MILCRQPIEITIAKITTTTTTTEIGFGTQYASFETNLFGRLTRSLCSDQAERSIFYIMSQQYKFR